MSDKATGNGTAAAEIKQVTPNGRILYDAESILSTETAKRHIETLRETQTGRDSVEHSTTKHK